MKYVVCIPSIYKPYTRACLKTIKIPKDRILIVDNTKINRGVPASWNLGIDKMIKEDCDWLIIMSAAVRFGDKGGMDFIEALENSKELLVEGGNRQAPWHLVALRKEVINKLGRFDENFFPGYFEDNEYAMRFIVGYPDKKHPIIPRVKVDMTDASVAHGMRLAGVKADNKKNMRYLFEKWGDVRYPKYKHPFNNPKNPISYWSEYKGEK